MSLGVGSGNSDNGGIITMSTASTTCGNGGGVLMNARSNHANTVRSISLTSGSSNLNNGGLLTLSW